MDAKIHGLLKAMPASLATVIVSWHGLSSVKSVADLSNHESCKPAESTVALSFGMTQPAMSATSLLHVEDQAARRPHRSATQVTDLERLALTEVLRTHFIAWHAERNQDTAGLDPGQVA